MTITVLSDEEHSRLRDVETAFKQNKQRYPYPRWSEARKALLDRLSNHGKIDYTEIGDGDFFVGEDWFETGALHLALIKWEALTPRILEECRNFLVSPHQDFLITVVKSMPAVEDMFELVITPSNAYVGFYGQTELQARTILNTIECYGAIKEFMG